MCQEGGAGYPPSRDGLRAAVLDSICLLSALVSGPLLSSRTTLTSSPPGSGLLGIPVTSATVLRGRAAFPLSGCGPRAPSRSERVLWRGRMPRRPSLLPGLQRMTFKWVLLSPALHSVGDCSAELLQRICSVLHGNCRLRNSPCPPSPSGS